MNTKHKLASAKRSISESLNKISGDEIYLGFTGLGDIDKTVLVQDKPGFIYVRIPKRIVTGTMEEYSEHIAVSSDEYRHNVPVKVVRNKKNPALYEVVGLWLAGMGKASVETMLGSVGVHHPNHELYNSHGGHDPIILDTIQIKNLQVVPTSPPSSKVIIRSGWYIWKDRTVHWYDGVLLELAETVPSGTFNNVYDSLWLDPTTDSIIQNLVSNIELPGFQTDLENLMIWPESDYIPLACVRLQGDTYQIDWSKTNVPNIIDMRPHQALMPGDMLPAIHPLNPPEGYHSGSLDSVYISESDPSGTYTYSNLHDILELELGPERTRVKVSSDDTTPNFLEDKIVVGGGGITMSVLNPGANEKLELLSTGGGGSSLTVKEIDNTPTVSNVNTIRLPTGTLTDDGGGQVTVGGLLLDSIYDAKGDLIIGRADNAPSRFPASVTDEDCLVSDSTQYAGLKWGKRRIQLTAARTYYVRGADGNDANSGLVDSASGAFATIQHAIDVASALDNGGYAITIQVRTGATYTGANTLKSYVGSGLITIIGDVVTPANVLVSITSGNCFTADGIIGKWLLTGMKLSTTTSGDCISASAGSFIDYYAINFGDCANYHVVSNTGSSIVAIDDYNITGDAVRHISSRYSGTSIVLADSITVILTGTPAFSGFFAAATDQAGIIATNITFTGGATGVRYVGNRLANIYTAAGGANYFPGDVAGSVSTGSQYN